MTNEAAKMRDGMPSAAAIAEHNKSGGIWIGAFGRLGTNGSIMFVSFDGDEMAVWDDEEWHNYEYTTSLAIALRSWSFWPCDEYGNKVLWPADDSGNML